MELNKWLFNAIAAIALAIGSVGSTNTSAQEKATKAAPTKTAAAEVEKPLAVVSITNLDRLLNDTSYLLKACNVPEFGGIISVMTTAYTQGLDKTRPLGLTLDFDGQSPTVVAFIPVADRQTFFDGLGGIGIEPDDLGDGLYEIAASGNAIFVKESNGWLYVAQTEDALDDVVENPQIMLGELPNKYDIAVQLNVQALPAEYRDYVTDQIRDGFERGLAEQGDATDDDAKVAREVAEAQLEQMEQNLRDTEQLIVGWAIDSKKQQTYLDGAVMFVAGSKLAAQMDANKDTKSDYTAFKLPDQAIHSRTSSKISAGEKEPLKGNLRNSIKQLEKRIEDIDNTQVSEALMKFTRGLVKIVEQSIDEGVLDGATSVSVADGTLRAIVGARVADGKAVAKQVQDLIASLKGLPGVPEVQFAYATHGGMTLHRTTIPIDSDDKPIQKMFNGKINVTIATGDKSVAVSIDPDGDASLKAALDAMKKTPAVTVPPVQAFVSVSRILQYAQSISPNSMIDVVLEEIKQHGDKDMVRLDASNIPRGAVYRLSIDEGVLRAAGTAGKAGQNNAGF
jgi:hypothetical protein